MKAEVLFEAGMQTGEGPLWDHRTGCLWCVDSTNPAVWCFSGDGVVIDRMSLPQCIGFVCLTDEPDVLIAGLEDGLYDLCPARRALTRLLDPEPGVAGNRINDATVDIDGSLVFGTLHSAYTRPTGAMYRLDSDGELTCFDRGYIVSNGPCALPDGRFLVANSEVREVYAFDRSAAGGFGNRRPFCEWDPQWGIPDGMVADVDGGVWIGCWDGAALIRLDAGGCITDRIVFPVSRVTKAAFGGPDLRRLYVTTANRDGDPRREPLAGALFAVDVPIPGIAARLLHSRLLSNIGPLGRPVSGASAASHGAYPSFR